MRKRKRPNYLSDYDNVFCEEGNEKDTTKTDVNSKKKKPKISVNIETKNETEKLMENLVGQCCICEETLMDGTDIQDSTGSSDSSYADILNSTFSGNNQQNSASQQFPRLRFSSGKICSFCKVPIQDIDLFQNKVIGLKKVLHNRVTVKVRESVVVEKQTRRGEKGVKHSIVLEEDKDKLKTVEESQISMSKTQISTRDEEDFQENLEGDEEVPDVHETPDKDKTRLKRKKLSTSMSEIEKAKIKNLKSDLKFQVKKRSKTGAYVIEYLKEKAGAKFLVKWENRHESENSWEPRSKIPSSVLKYYEEDLGRLGTPVPVLGAQLSKSGKERKVGDKSQSESVGKSGQEKKKKSSVKRGKDTTQEEVHLKSEAEGEYIEDATFELIDVDRTEKGNVRKSSRHPKPKVFHDSIVTSRPIERSVSPAVTDKKSKKNEIDGNTPRKSKRGPKPNKYYITDESPKKSQCKEDVKKEEDNNYIIESLVDEKKGKYLVKWESYPSSSNTWEPRSSLPSFIVKFYEQDPSRLGMPAPDVS